MPLRRYYRGMETTFAIFDTVTERFTEFASTGVVERKGGTGYVKGQGTYVFTVTDEAVAREELARLNRQFKRPGRYKLFIGQLG